MTTNEAISRLNAAGFTVHDISPSIYSVRQSGEEAADVVGEWAVSVTRENICMRLRNLRLNDAVETLIRVAGAKGEGRP